MRGLGLCGVGHPLSDRSPCDEPSPRLAPQSYRRRQQTSRPPDYRLPLLLNSKPLGARRIQVSPVTTLLFLPELFSLFFLLAPFFSRRQLPFFRPPKKLHFSVPSPPALCSSFSGEYFFALLPLSIPSSLPHYPSYLVSLFLRCSILT